MAARIGPELAWLAVDDPESFVSVRRKLRGALVCALFTVSSSGADTGIRVYTRGQGRTQPDVGGGHYLCGHRRP
jgi:hypothetical protein